MPVATVDTEYTKRFDLKTVPEGWVEIRVMSYGDYLKRRDMATKMAMEGRPGSRDTKVTIDTIQTEVTLFEFQKCVVDHNLTDRVDRKLNLANRNDFVQLNPRVGAEIQTYIDELNQFEEAASDDLFRTDSDDSSSGQEG